MGIQVVLFFCVRTAVLRWKVRLSAVLLAPCSVLRFAFSGSCVIAAALVAVFQKLSSDCFVRLLLHMSGESVLGESDFLLVL